MSIAENIDATPATDVMANVTDPAIRATIEDFLTDYVHAIDDGRIPEWPEFFTPDGFYQITNRDNYNAGRPIGIMQCNGQGMMKDRVKAMYEANIFEPHVYCHLLGRPRIQEEAPGLYHARTNFQIIRTMQDGGQTVFATGKYIDVIAINGTGDGTGPKFKNRRVILDSRRVDILIVFPL